MDFIYSISWRVPLPLTQLVQLYGASIREWCLCLYITICIIRMTHCMCFNSIVMHVSISCLSIITVKSNRPNVWRPLPSNPAKYNNKKKIKQKEIKQYANMRSGRIELIVWSYKTIRLEIQLLVIRFNCLLILYHKIIITIIKQMDAVPYVPQLTKEKSIFRNKIEIARTW